MLEKQLTTPDIYPLTLNSLRLACNQSTNRDPVVDYDDAILRDALHHLERRGYTRLASGREPRPEVPPPARRSAADERATSRRCMCVLMLRGPQTPGELKQRTERMHAFADLAAVHETLDRLIERELVVRLERRPGQKEERYAQLLERRMHEEDVAQRSVQPRSRSPAHVADVRRRSSAAAVEPRRAARRACEQRVARLEREVAGATRRRWASRSSRRVTSPTPTVAHRS